MDPAAIARWCGARREAYAAGGEARLGATLSVHPGHAVGDAPELILLAGYRLPF